MDINAPIEVHHLNKALLLLSAYLQNLEITDFQSTQFENLQEKQTQSDW